MNDGREQAPQERKKPTLIAYSVKLNEDQAIWTYRRGLGAQEGARVFDSARCLAAGGADRVGRASRGPEDGGEQG